MTPVATVARRCLVGIGLLFCLVAILQAALAFGDASWSAFFGAPKWALALLREGGIRLALVATVAIGGSLGIAICCLSGGGVIRQFRGVRASLYVIGGLMTLWGLRVFALVALGLAGAGGVRRQLYLVRGAPLALGIMMLWAVSNLGADMTSGRAQRH